MHDPARTAFARFAAPVTFVRTRFHRHAPPLGRAIDALIRCGACTYAKFELPRCVGLVESCIQKFPQAWPRSGVRECRGCWHGYRLRLDLSDYFQRCDYFLRRYHDVPLQFLIGRAVRAGDTVIDAGANNGLVAMYAAWRVGPQGLVHAFEPNPRMLEQVRWHVETNGLSQIRIHALGLSDREAELELCVPGDDNFGAGTFAAIPDRYHGVTAGAWPARVAPADNLPNLEVRGSLVIKMDIEGFEVQALDGMKDIIERHRPLVISEINEEMLSQAGTSGRELVSRLCGRGYHAYSFRTRRAILRHRRLELKKVSPDRDRFPLDLAFIHPSSVFMDRLKPFLVSQDRFQPHSEQPSPLPARS